MKDIIINEEGKIYKIKFSSGNPYRRYYVGKSFPRTTQCVVECNGLVIGVGQVVKHEKDKDNIQYAQRLAAKKALEGILWKEIKSKIWEEIFENQILIKNK